MSQEIAKSPSGRGSRQERRARAVVSMLLRAYPPAFRRQHASAMSDTLLEVWQKSDGSRSGRIRFWFATAGDLGREGLAERIRPSAPRGSGGSGGSGRSPEGGGAFRGLRDDLTRALVGLVRAPGFTLLTTLILALGIGANVAVLSLIDRVVLRPVRVSEPDRLVRIYEATSIEAPEGGLYYTVFKSLQDNVTLFDGLAASAENEAELRLDDRALAVQAGLVSGNFFQLLGVPAALGRTLVAEDEGAWGSEAVVVLSWHLWQTVFGADPGIIGRSLNLGDGVFTVVGVAPTRFAGTSLTWTTDLWIPVSAGGLASGSSGLFEVEAVLTTPLVPIFEVHGRLTEGANPELAADELNRVRLTLAEDRAEGVARPLTTVPLRRAAAAASRGDLMRFLALLGGVVGCTFLVACINVSNLMSVRSRQRARITAVKAALGASRARIFREQTLEALLVALMASGGSVLAAWTTLATLKGFTLPGGVDVQRAGTDLGLGVFALAAGLGLFSALLFGTVPAWRASRGVEMVSLGSRQGHGRGRGSWWFLIAAQVCLSMVLMVGAALFARSIWVGQRVDTGLDPQGVAAATVRLGPHGVAIEDIPTAVEQFMDGVRREPGIDAVAFASHVPIARRRVALPYIADEDESTRLSTGINVVTPEYFDILGIRLLAGRLLDDGDQLGSERVIVVNEAAALALWGTDDPRGRVGRTFFGGRSVTVVGVVAQTLTNDLSSRDEPYVYYPLAQFPGPVLGIGSFIARGAGRREPPTAALQRAIQQVDPHLPIQDVRNVDRQINQIMAPQRLGATLLGLSAALALLIASIGIYGVAAWRVASQRREIGIRMALGAKSPRLLTEVLGQTATATVAGVVTGAVVAGALTRLIASFLFEVAPLDPSAFVIAAGALVLATAVATLLPAQRAVRIDPAETMRIE